MIKPMAPEGTIFPSRWLPAFRTGSFDTTLHDRLLCFNLREDYGSLFSVDLWTRDEPSVDLPMANAAKKNAFTRLLQNKTPRHCGGNHPA
jgi:hypothetical protein